MSSDSSDDEDLSKFREAADSQFIRDSMFDKSKCAYKVRLSEFFCNCVFILAKISEERKIEKPQSLRRNKDDEEQFNVVRVSPEFRDHVAKHLSNMLEELLQKKLSHKTTNYDSYIKPKRRKSGIKLFRDSSHYVKLKSKAETVPVKKNNTKKTENSDEDDEKFKCVAVHATDILTQKETKHWSTRSKAPVYAYTQTKNGLVLK
jgi:hypothetical protein